MRKFSPLTFFKKFLSKVFTVFIFLTAPSSVFADGLGDGSDGSPNISGVINVYASVISITPSTCSSAITVVSSAGFSAGDLVLIIQMENAVINTTNTPSYGTIINYNNSGNFEYAKIFSLAGTVIQTVAPLVNSYDVLGVVQLVRVPQYVNPTITGTVTCPAWNGIAGGIIAFDATGTVTMNADIDASGKGFRGGTYQPAVDIAIHLGNYTGLNQVDSFSYKGEGIASYNIVPFVSGRGAAANGGGGGNSHNGGGGGGANAGCGGNGGYGYTASYLGPNYAIAQGIGGHALTNSGAPFKIFMGGGGGAGNSDNFSNSAGAYGGGIIFITANSLDGNSKFISSNGNSTSNVVIDGAGGAGAGGTVIFDCAGVSSTVKLDVHGGDGGNVTAFPDDPHGPGGGGGGGLIAFTSAALPANVTVNSINGGMAGICDGTTFNGASDGCIGNTSFNLVLPKQLTNPTTITAQDTSFCDNGTLTLNATTGTTYSWSPPTGLSCTNCQSPVATVNATTSYIATVTFSSCIYIDTFNVEIKQLPNVTLSPFNPVCEDAAVVALSGGNPSGGTFSGTGVTGGNFNPSVAGAGSHVITYSYTDASGCSNSATENITVNALPALGFTPLNPVCADAPSFLLTGGSPAGGTYSGSGVTGNNFDASVAGIGAHTITYLYTDANGCSNSTTSNITVNALPNVTLANFSPVCVNASSFALSGGSPAGGTYTGTGVSANNFDPAIAGTGTHAIVYTYTDANGCSKTATKNITVNTLPAIIFSAITPVCVTAPAFVLIAGTPSGGSYSGAGVNAGNFTPSIAGTGTHTIYYSYTNANGCSNMDSTTITVYDIPLVTFTPVNPVCDGAPAFPLTGGSPAGGTYSGIGVTGNNFDPAIAGIGTQTITYSYTDAQGCFNATTAGVTVNPLPNVMLSNFSSACENSSSFPLSGGSPAGGNYSGTGITANNFDPSAAGTGIHPVTYSYTDTNGCSNSAIKNITVTALPAVTLTTVNPVCITSPAFTLSTGSPSGGTYSGMGVSGNSFDPVAAGSGIHKVYYTYTDVNGCSNSDSTTITVYDIPIVTFTPVNPVCDGAPAFTLTGGSPSGGTYSGVGVTGNIFDPAVAGTGTQTITYFYTDAQGCSNSTTTNITVNALPNVTLSNFSSVCVDASPFALSGGSPAGGTFTGTGVNSNTFDPFVAGVGIFSITYSYTDVNGCSKTKTKNITVNALPLVTLSSINPVCITSPAFALNTGTPAGGAYSGIGVTGNNFDPASAGTGTHKIYYTFTDVSGCSGSDSTTVTVYNIPLVAFTPVNPVCDGAPSFVLTGGSPAGGIYSGVGVAGNSFDPAIAGVGTQTITYSYTDAQGCSNSTATNITVNALPNVTLSNFNSVCADALPFALSGGSPAGGTYSGTGVSGNNFDPSVTGAGIYPVTYSYTDANGCSNTKTQNINVNALPTVTLSAINPVCIASPAFILNAGTPAGGTYSGTGVSGSNFTPSAAGTGTHKIYYYYTDANGCANSDSTTITVYNIPAITFTPLDSICDGMPAFALTNASPPGGTYSGAGVSANIFDPGIAGIGIQTITYSYTDAQGCSNSAATNITVNALPNVTLSNFNSVCEDASPFTLNGGSPAGGIYSGAGVSVNNFNPATAGSGIHPIIYTYTDVNGCGNSATKNITVNALPNVILSPINPVCIASSSFSLTTGTPSGGTYSGTGVSGGSFTPVIAGTGIHSIYYFYMDINGCSGSDSTTITVYNIPAIAFTPINPVCEGTPAFALTNASPAGGTYSGAGVSGNIFDPVIAGTGTHTITYSYTDAQGCSNSGSTTITVNALPNVTLSNFNSVCADVPSFSLNGGSPAGGSYTGTGVSANNFDPAAAGTGTHAITYTYTDANGCSNSSTKNLTVNPLPAVTLSAINSVCIASSAFALNAGIPAGGTYSGIGVNGGNFNPATAGIGTHKIYYSYTDLNGCSNSDSTTITVYNIPQVTFASVNPVCDGTPAFSLTGGTPAGGTYTGAGVTGNIFDPAVAGIGTHVIIYSYTDAQGCSNSAAANITVNPLPNVTLSNFSSVCADAPSFALIGGFPAGGTYTGAGVIANNFYPVTAGVGTHQITYSYTDINGCTNTKTKAITVNALPIVTLSAINPVCIVSSAFALTAGTPSGGTYSGAGVTGGIFTPSIAGTGIHTVYYDYTDANGCSNVDSTTVTVYNLPQVTFSAVNPVCDGAPAFTLTGGTPAGGTYSGTGVSANIFDPAVAGVGTQAITYIYTDGNGCSGSAVSSVTVNALPNVSLTNFNSVCEDAPTFTLSGGLPAGGNYSGAGVAGNNFNPAVAGAGTHAINYSFTDTNSCTNSVSKNLTVNPLIFLNAGSDQTICSGYSIQLNATGSSVVHWTPSAGLSCTYCTNPIASPSDTTSYIISSSLPCSINDTMTVSVVPAVVVDAGNDTLLCFGESLQLKAVSNYSSYSWNATDVLSCFSCPDPVLSPQYSGVYTVTSTNGICSAADSVFVQVTKVETDAGKDMTIVFGETIQLNAEGADSYVWSPGLSVNDSTLQSPVASPDSTTQFIVTGNIGRCSDMDSVTIEIIYVGDAVFVPNAFTPNGDGKNDFFAVIHAGKYDSFELKIFNRWGEIVFQSAKISHAWDGVFKGKKLPEDVYTYNIQLVSGKNKVVKAGNVTLLR